jgi:hypothetical protein
MYRMTTMDAPRRLANDTQEQLPVLRFVDSSLLIPHERSDINRESRLVSRLQEENVLRNPPIVAPIPGGPSYVVLDGANRATVIRSIGCPHILVQIVDYTDPRIELLNWNHVITDVDREDFLVGLSNIPGAEARPLRYTEALTLLEKRQLVGILAFPTSEVFGLGGPGETLDQIRLLNRIVELYEGRSDIHRVITSDPKEMFRNYPMAKAALVFPRLTPQDIISVVSQGFRVPPGITRHIIPGRALRVNVSLDILREEVPLDQKNRWLEDFIRRKLVNKEIRYYREPVFLFDE